MVHHDPQLVQALEALVDPDTRGDPMSPLRWTCKSTRVLARLLTAQGHPVSYMTVAQLLHDLHYSLQGNAKTKEGKQHPDRDAQFRYIQRQGESFLGRGWPVISIDTKKKELVGKGPIPKSGDAPKSTGVRYAKGRRPNNTGDWQLGKSPLWKCFWSRKSKWAGTRKREEESVSVPTALRHPRQPPSRTRRDGC